MDDRGLLFAATVVAAAAALGVVADQAGGGDGDAAPVGCTCATRVEAVPTTGTGSGARAGPIWFVVGGGEPTLTVPLLPPVAERFHPTKVLIQAPRPLTSAVSLRGRRCADGRPVRFWYRGGVVPLPQNPATAAQLARAGDRIARLRPGEARPSDPGGPRTDYRGYILFYSPGHWVVTARQGGRLVGTVIFEVVR
jgi:hypothetical protein